jgi:hypothetical protein
MNCKNCNKPITNPRNEKYCSFECVCDSQLKYNDSIRRYVAEHITLRPLQDIATDINVKVGGLKRQISKWRSQGFDIGGNTHQHYSKK